MEDRQPGVGLCLLPKLKFEHITLTSFSKMRVDLAAQVNFVCVHTSTSVCMCFNSIGVCVCIYSVHKHLYIHLLSKGAQ